MIERVDGDVGTLGNFFSRFVVEIVSSLALMAGILVLMFTIDWRVGLVFCLFCVLTLLLMYRLKDAAVPHYRKARQATAELFGFLEERLSGTEDVRANGAVGYARRTVSTSSPGRCCATGRWLRRWGCCRLARPGCCSPSGRRCRWAWGLTCTCTGWPASARSSSFFRYADLLNQPLDSLTRQFQDLQQAGGLRHPALYLLALRSALPDTGQREPAGWNGPGRSLRRHGLCLFRPPVGSNPTPDDKNNDNSGETEQVLDGINFHLPPGTILGLLGRTGSGKTTLTRLRVRFYDPGQGCCAWERCRYPSCRWPCCASASAW